MDHESAVEWVNDRIVEQPGRVMLAFLVVTLVFAAGLGDVSTAAGTQQFSQDVPANRALERINSEFGPRFGTDTGSTQLIQRDRNVLSRSAMLAMLRSQKRVADRTDLRVVRTDSAAGVVARTIDPSARTLDAQIRTIERATPREIDRAVRANAGNPRFESLLSEDFNPTAASASATIGTVAHEVPAGLSTSAGQGGDTPLTPLQTRTVRVVDSVERNRITVFGQGIVADEFTAVITDSLLLVTPAAVLFILFFLVVAYRDPLDLLLGVVSLGMAIVWTFGFLGLADIPFNQIMISIPPLLLAVGIDFGIHAVNRYREAREELGDAGAGPPGIHDPDSTAGADDANDANGTDPGTTDGPSPATDGGRDSDSTVPDPGEGIDANADPDPDHDPDEDSDREPGDDPESGGDPEPGAVMQIASRQLLVAFFIVTGTTVIGFLSNYTSDLPPIKDFGVAAAVGIVFTFLVFGVFLPAAKVWLDRVRARYPVVPTFSRRPLGAEGSALGRLLQVGVVVADRAPVVFLLLVVVSTAGMANYATGIDTSFSQEDFLPPEDTPAVLDRLPEPFRPGDYRVTATTNFLQERFESGQRDTVTVYVQRRMTDPTALESIHRAGRDPPGSFVSRDGRAAETSIVTVIQDRARRDPAFRRLVQRNDRDGNGVPDRNLDRVYDELLDSPARDRALQYIARDYRSTRVVYTVESDAATDRVVADGKRVAERFRGDATATGQIVVFDAISGLIFDSAITSLTVALSLTVVFLVVVYRVVEGYASLGVVNTVPIVVAVAAIAASMRFLGVPFNAVTATVLSITIGLGVDYSVHVVHRFVDERHDRPLVAALERTVRGTGGALAGSMLTTVSGTGVLLLAILTVLGQFGLITALSIFLSFLASILVLPPTLAVWDRIVVGDPSVPIDAPAVD